MAPKAAGGLRRTASGRLLPMDDEAPIRCAHLAASPHEHSQMLCAMPLRDSNGDDLHNTGSGGELGGWADCLRMNCSAGSSQFARSGKESVSLWRPGRRRFWVKQRRLVAVEMRPVSPGTRLPPVLLPPAAVQDAATRTWPAGRGHVPRPRPTMRRSGDHATQSLRDIFYAHGWPL